MLKWRALEKVKFLDPQINNKEASGSDAREHMLDKRESKGFGKDRSSILFMTINSNSHKSQRHRQERQQKNT